MIKVTVAAQEEQENQMKSDASLMREDSNTTQTEINGALFDVVANESEESRLA